MILDDCISIFKHYACKKRKNRTKKPTIYEWINKHLYFCNITRKK